MGAHIPLKVFSLLFFCLSLFFAAPPCFAGEPTVQVRQRVDAVLEVLKNKELKRPERETIRRAKIREIVDTIFDFPEMSRRSLGIHWRKRTPDERKEFVSLFSDLLEDTYIKKIEKYHDEKILYTGESVRGDYAVVKTKVITTKETEIPIDYRLLKENNKWEVYDVVIEGVSLVNNYRSQFSEILSSKPYAELVNRLKKKTLKEPAK
jgi:phospholipid transport system substrate-binding protein